MRIDIEDSFSYFIELPFPKELESSMSSWLSSDQNTYADKRKSDFLAGRYCAKKAFSLIDFNLIELPIAKDRSPIWPKGFVGSITHTKTCAIAAVSNKLKGLGIDAEVLMSEERFHNIKRMIVSESEESMAQKDLKIIPTLIFSAKESLYKTLYPLCKEYFGFLDATLVDYDKKSFKLKLHSKVESVSKFNGDFVGHYLVENDTLVTWISYK